MVLLNPGETVVKQANVVRLNPQGTRPGVLTLTNHRLVFEAHVPRGPMGGPIVRTTIDAPLGRIRNAGAPGATRLQIELPMQVGVFETPEAAAWLQAITEARSHAPPAMGGPGGPLGPGAPGMPPAVVLRCRYCGLLNQPTVTKCTGCGAPI